MYKTLHFSLAIFILCNLHEVLHQNLFRGSLRLRRLTLKLSTPLFVQHIVVEWFCECVARVWFALCVNVWIWIRTAECICILCMKRTYTWCLLFKCLTIKWCLSVYHINILSNGLLIFRLGRSKNGTLQQWQNREMSRKALCCLLNWFWV